MEYQFSDMSLLANESFHKQMNKDPEGYGKDFEFLFSFLPPLHLGLKWYHLIDGRCFGLQFQ